MEKLEYLEINAHTNKKYALIWLHGLGAGAHDFSFIGDALGIGDDYYVVCPNAPIRPVSINGNMEMRSWHDISSLTSPEKNLYHGIFDSEQMIVALIEELVLKGFMHETIMLGGFSQGGAMSLWVSIRYKHLLKGAICLSGYVPSIMLMHENSMNGYSELPIFIGHGKEDITVLKENADTTIEWLIAKKYNVDSYFYSMGHEVCQSEFEDLKIWISTSL
jgi:phospholipase/carboxylesterase